MNAWSLADAAAPALALGYSVGRIGCFLVGDDFGMPTKSALGREVPGWGSGADDCRSDAARVWGGSTARNPR